MTNPRVRVWLSGVFLNHPPPWPGGAFLSLKCSCKTNANPGNLGKSGESTPEFFILKFPSGNGNKNSSLVPLVLFWGAFTPWQRGGCLSPFKVSTSRLFCRGPFILQTLLQGQCLGRQYARSETVFSCLQAPRPGEGLQNTIYSRGIPPILPEETCELCYSNVHMCIHMCIYTELHTHTTIYN